jgi:hypothetical protein
MTKRVLTSMLAMCACATIAFAQATPQGGAQTPGTTSPQTPAQTSRPDLSAAKTSAVTLEGCIQRNAPANATTPGATGTAGSAAGAFVLVNATKSMGNAGAAPNAAAPATGAAGRPSASPSSAAIGPTYRLDAEDSKLSPHVGHKVEISGTVEEGSSANAAAAPSAAASNASSANVPKLKVDSIKMMAASCTP